MKKKKKAAKKRASKKRRAVGIPAVVDVPNKRGAAGRFRGKTANTTLSDGIQKTIATVSDSSLCFTQQAAEFRKNLLFTGLFEVDLALRLSFGNRLGLLGAPHSGKTRMCYKLLGAAQRTCRQCMTPIIPFMNEDTGEIVSACLCGAMDPCRVIYVDLENEFDPAWAAIWGFDIGTSDYSDDGLNEFDEVIEGVRVSPDSKVAIAKVTTAEGVRDIVSSLFTIGAVDVLAIDSLTVMNPKSRLEGKWMLGDRAKAISDFLNQLMSAQVSQWIEEGISPTLIFTNQTRKNIGIANPRANPNTPAGGEALKFSVMQYLTLRTKYNDGLDKGWTQPQTIADVTATADKDKLTGATNVSARFRDFIRPWTSNRIRYAPGENDSGSRLFDVCRTLGTDGFPPAEYEANPLWYHKDTKGHHCLGRCCKTVTELKQLLNRPDIQYQVMLPLMAIQGGSPSLLKHLRPERFLYNPFENEPIFELIHECREHLEATTSEPSSGGSDEAPGEDTAVPEGSGAAEGDDFENPFAS
jgi:RecA/RadA recombinase